MKERKAVPKEGNGVMEKTSQNRSLKHKSLYSPEILITPKTAFKASLGSSN